MTKPFSFLCKTTALAFALASLNSHANADSLWKDGNSRNACADKKAHAVGDILTVLIQENNGATRNNNTTTAKKSSINASIASLFYPPSASGLLTKQGNLPQLSTTSDTEFNGGGTLSRAETITAQMAVRVVDVLPNGNMVIEGNLHTAFSGEKQDAVVRGTVRPDDITANNTLLSFNIADANIQFLSKGVITDSTKKGWFNTIWDKLSPF